MLRRRIAVIAATVLVIGTLLLLYLTFATPRYTATAQLMLGSPAPEVVDLRVVAAEPSRDDTLVTSELQVLRSRELASRVIDRLQLDRLPEFAAPGQTDAGSTTRRTQLVNAFLERLDVSALKESRIAQIAFTAADPQLATQVVNTLADFYLLGQREAKLAATDATASWLQQQVDDAERSLLDAERAATLFQYRHRLLSDAEGDSLLARDLSDASARLREAENARIEAESRLRQFQGTSADALNLSALARIVDLGAVPQLREREQALEAEVASLAARYSSRNVMLRTARRDLAAVRARIDAELRQLVDGLRLGVDMARAREQSLRQRLTQLERDLERAGLARVQLQSLQREAESGRRLLSTLRERLQQARSLQDIDRQRADARVVSRAAVPDRPSTPRSPKLLAAGLLAALFIGVLIALLIEQLRPPPAQARAAVRTGFRTSFDVESVARLPVIAKLPMLSDVGDAASPEAVSEALGRRCAGELKNLYSAHLARNGRSGKGLRVLIASAQEREGKTTTAAALARVAARAGRRVVVVDAALRGPGLHQAFGVPQQQVGLVDLLLKKALPEYALQRDRSSGVCYLCAGARAAFPPELLSSAHMNELLGYLSANFDLVLIDSTALMSAPDARILAKRTDLSLFLLRWSTTGRDQVSAALKWVNPAETEVAGVVFTMVDAKRVAGKNGAGLRLRASRA